jgi:heme oxygenase
MSDQMLAKIPRCAGPTTVDTPARRLGALYVVEGSTLGGRQLARHLDPLLGTTGSAGRRFFLGRGAETNTVWNAFLAQMALLANTPADRQDAVEAAVQTFGIFQEWLGGWRDLAV